MLTIEEALALLFDTVRASKRHKDYQHVCDLAILYEQLITGKDIDKLLLQFVRRETTKEFQQRVLLTQQICPAWAESIMTPFYLVGRLDNVNRAINFSEGVQNADTKRAEIEDAIGSFYGHESLEEFLATRYVELSFTDPNAFIVVEYDEFNPLIEKASPYPIEYSSTEAINFLYKKNKLQWLIIKEPDVPVKLADNTKRNAAAYRMYTSDFAIRIQETFEFEQQFSGNNYSVTDPNAVINGYWYQSSNKVFAVTIVEPQVGEIQAIRVGYKSDLQTKGRTLVSPLNPAIVYFRKSIKLVSESDLSDSLHAFPHLAQYTEVCEGNLVKDLSCNKGVDQNGRVCKVCNGLGLKVLKSAQDAVYLPFPRPGVNNPVKPSDVVAYATTPVELLRYQNDKIDSLELKAKRSIYNAETLIKSTVSDTATGENIKQNEKNNTLYPFAKNNARFWKFAVRTSAAITDNNEGLEAVCEYPKDLKLMSEDELLDVLKRATDSGAPSFFIQSLQRDLAQKINAGNDYGYLKIVVKEKFTPFIGKSPEEIMFILSSGYARIEDQILYTHSDTIFDELEQDEEGFYKYTYKKQWELIKGKIELIKAALPKPATAMEFSNNLTEA
jgi:hypothetical protein